MIECLVILRREDEALWLDRDITEPELLRYLFVPYPENEMHAYPVSKRV
jgi:putative SOS response-associated peptidase YedK